MPTKKPTFNAQLAALEVVIDHLLDRVEQLEGTRATVDDLDLVKRQSATKTELLSYAASKADLLDYAKRGGDVHVPLFSTTGTIL